MEVLKHACTVPAPLTTTDLAPTAHWLKRLARRLRHALLACSWHNGSVIFISSRKCLRKNREDQLKNSYWFIWHPYSPIKFYWDCFTMLSNLAAKFYMPWQVFYTCPPQADVFILVTDAISFWDIIVIFISGYHDEDNKQFIMEPSKIALHYLRGLFIFDLIGCLPLQLYMPFENCNYPSHTIFFPLKLFKTFSQHRKTTIFLEQLKVSYFSTELVIVAVRMLYFFHWMTYFHYQVPAFYAHFIDLDTPSKETRWLQRYEVNNKSTLFEKYVANLYCVSGHCIGAGSYSPVDETVIPEKILNSVMAIVGIVFLSDCFMTVIRLVLYSQYQKYAYDCRLNDLEKYMIAKRLPRGLRRKVQVFLNYKFGGAFFNEASILSTLNEQIKQEINLYTCKRLLMHVSLFRDMPVALINTIVFSLKHETLLPGQVILKAGGPSECMYFIYFGSVTLMDENGKEIIHLRDGDYFGESAMMHSESFVNVTVIVLEITEIFVLNSHDFQVCIQPYRYLRRQLEAHRRRRRVSRLQN